MSVPKGLNAVKSADFSGNGGIIDSYKGNGLSVSSHALVTEETKQRVIDATKTITSDFKTLENYSEPIKFGDVKGGLAVNNYDSKIGKNQIILSKDGFSDTRKLLELLKKDFESGISYDTDLVESLVAHEIGHNAHIALALKRIGAEYGKPLTPIQNELLSREYQKISQEIYLHCFTDEDFIRIQNDCTNELGLMVYCNPNELIAQSFGNYYYGKQKSKIAKDVVTYFMKELK